MTQAIRPMLATSVSWDHVRYPVLVSPKVDGVRFIGYDSQAMSRTWKPFPNRSLQEAVREAGSVLHGLDGELVVGSPADPEVYTRTMSGVMSQAGDPDVRLLAFDLVTYPSWSYADRRARLEERQSRFPGWIRVLEQLLCRSPAAVEQAEEEFLAQGYEGVVLRDPQGRYKYGRSTAREGLLLKVKRYADTEAVILGTEELMHNGNEAARDVQGITRRSHVSSGLVPAGTLGALNVALLHNPSVRFSVGTGFTAAQRAKLWSQRAALPGHVVKIRYMQHGVLDSTGVPRHPVFLGFRDVTDL